MKQMKKKIKSSRQGGFLAHRACLTLVYLLFCYRSLFLVILSSEWLEGGKTKMKPLEIGLFVVTSIILYGSVFGWLRGRKWFGVAASGVVFLVLHVVVDGFRVQMIPLYMLFVVCGLSFWVRRVRGRGLNQDTKPKRWKWIIVGTAGTLALAIALIVPLYLLPIVKLEEPTGPYAVGRTDYHWVDEQRAEGFTTDPDDHREIMVRAWYPAELTKKAKKASYAYEAEEARLVESSQPFYIRAVLRSVFQGKNHSYAEVPVAEGEEEYPVLIFSSGYGLSNFMYANQAEELASHGYIVFGIEHPYYTLLPTVFPDGRITEGMVEFTDDWKSMDEHMKVWVEDVRFAIGKLKELNQRDPQGWMTGRLDLERIGMFGHSFGGAATVQVMDQDLRIRAGVNMDGFPAGAVIEDGLQNPFLFMISSDLKRLEVEQVSKKGFDPAGEEYMKRKKGILKNGGTEVVIAKSDHMSFSDAMLYSPLLGKRDLSMLREINQVLLQFFDEHVKGAPSERKSSNLPIGRFFHMELKALLWDST